MEPWNHKRNHERNPQRDIITRRSAPGGVDQDAADGTVAKGAVDKDAAGDTPAKGGVDKDPADWQMEYSPEDIENYQSAKYKFVAEHYLDPTAKKILDSHQRQLKTLLDSHNHSHVHWEHLKQIMEA